MTEDNELVHGSGNVFRDLGLANSEAEQLKAILATQIVAVLDIENPSFGRADELTGFSAADFSRVRQAKLGHFTIDRLMAMLEWKGKLTFDSMDNKVW
jgi:predicted XRE-type DNA-binding protein